MRAQSGSAQLRFCFFYIKIIQCALIGMRKESVAAWNRTQVMKYLSMLTIRLPLTILYPSKIRQISDVETFLLYLAQAFIALHLWNPFLEHKMGSILLSTVHELSRKDEKSSKSCDSNPGPLGEKRERNLCAMQPPPIWRLAPDKSKLVNFRILYVRSKRYLTH